MTIDRSTLTHKVRVPSVGSDETGDSWQERFLEAHNAERAKEGLLPLALDDRLTEAAQIRATHMGKNGYFSHDNPPGGPGKYWQLLNAMGVRYRVAGENLATNNAQDNVAVAMRGLMQSPDHRANVMESRYTHAGFAAAIYEKPVPGKGYTHVMVCIYGELTNA